MHNRKLPTWDKNSLDDLRPFSAIRLIAIDIDGTLIESSNQSLEKLKNLIRSLKYFSKNKIVLTLATGRTLKGVGNYLELVSNQKTPLVLYNGSVVFNPHASQCLLRRQISIDSFEKIISICHDLHLKCYSYFFSSEYETIFTQDLEQVWGWSDSRRPEYDFNNMKILWQDKLPTNSHEQPTAILVETSDENIKHSLHEKLASILNISVTSSGGPFIEIRPYGSNKGVALKYLAEHLSIPQHAVLALGDNDNDAEMLEWAGIGVSIQAASQLAQEKSDYICNRGIAEGAIEVLRLIRNSQKYFVTYGGSNI